MSCLRCSLDVGLPICCGTGQLTSDRSRGLTYLLLVVKLNTRHVSCKQSTFGRVESYHHLLHHSPCLAVKVAQLGIFRRELRRVDARMVSEDVWPPLGC